MVGVGDDGAVPDAVLERRIRIAKLVKAGKRIGYSLFLIAIVLFGVYPQLMFKVMDPAVTVLVENITAGAR